MMAHGAMLWGAALYNNGGFHIKDTRFGESYNEDGNPQTLLANPQPTREEEAFKGFLPFLEPLPRWEISQPGNILRVFERGGRRRLEVGLPDKEEENGKPDKGLSPRGLGTLESHRSGFSRFAENPSDGSDFEYARHERSSRRFPFRRMHLVSRHLCK